VSSDFTDVFQQELQMMTHLPTFVCPEHCKELHGTSWVPLIPAHW